MFVEVMLFEFLQLWLENMGGWNPSCRDKPSPIPEIEGVFQLRASQTEPTVECYRNRTRLRLMIRHPPRQVFFRKRSENVEGTR